MLLASSAVIAGTAAATFVGTNLDDLLVLTVLNASSKADGRPRLRQIWAGQFLGVGVLVLVSALAAAGLAVVPVGWIWLLGLLPLGLGVYKLVTVLRDRARGEQSSSVVASGLAGVVGITIANGGDNVAAYIPLFRTLDGTGYAITILVFAAGVAVWCLLGAVFVAHRTAVRVIRVWGPWVIPWIYMAIGVYVMYKGGLFGG